MSGKAASRRLWKWKILKAVAHARRHPYILAIIFFASGLASFLLVDRQERMAGVIAVLMLAGWVWLLLEEPIRRIVRLVTGLTIPPSLIRFTTQVVHQESFFFVLPFFAITTTWHSPQAVFTIMIGLAGLISIIDPIYHGRLARHRWLFLAYHCLALSVVLLTALPIIVHLTTWESYAITTALTVTLALPSIIQVVPLGGMLKGAGMDAQARLPSESGRPMAGQGYDRVGADARRDPLPGLGIVEVRAPRGPRLFTAPAWWGG